MKLHKSSACFLGRHNAHFIIHTTGKQAFITGKRNFAISKQREDCVTHNHTSQRTKNRLFFLFCVRHGRSSDVGARRFIIRAGALALLYSLAHNKMFKNNSKKGSGVIIKIIMAALGVERIR
jgi:hypothetical protein